MKIQIGQIVKSPDGLGRVVDKLFDEYQIRFGPGIFAWYKQYNLKKECQCAHCSNSEYCDTINKKYIYSCSNLEVRNGSEGRL